jgi:hypothetical protein
MSVEEALPIAKRHAKIARAINSEMVTTSLAALDALVSAVGERQWRPITEPPPKDRVFAITVAGPQIDLCSWDETQGAFLDYYYKQRIALQWPYMVAWRLIEPADVYKFRPAPPSEPQRGA